MNNQLSINYSTIISLIKRQVYMRLNAIYISFGTVMSVVFLLLISKIVPTGSFNDDVFLSIVFPAFFIGGLIFTSNIFSELNKPQSSMFYLMLPASALEKLISSWFLTSFLFLAFSIVLAYIINLLLALVSGMFFSSEFFIVNLFSVNALKFYSAYLFFNAVFILGAVSFRRNNFLRTVFSMFLFVLIMGIVGITIGWFFFSDLFQVGYWQNIQFSSQHYFSCSGSSVLSSFIHVTVYLFTVGFLMTVSYFKLKERQV